MRISEWRRLTVSEVMVRDVVTLRPSDILAHASYTFLHHQISGAPVVDNDGVCVGVLSVTDILRAGDKVDEQRAHAAEQIFAKSDLYFPVRVYEHQLSQVRDKLAPVAERCVGEFMVQDIVAVLESDTLEVVVKDFVEAHVHRLIVTEPNGKLKGVISTIDIMASLLRIPE